VGTAPLTQHISVIGQTPRSVDMIELTPRRTVNNSQDRVATDNSQTRRVFLALLLLMIALVVLLLKDQGIWFNSDQSILDSDEHVTTVGSKSAETSAPAATNQTHSIPASATKKKVAVAKPTIEPRSADTLVVTANRTPLAPLDVQVIAGNARSTVHPGNNSSKGQITHPQATAPSPATANIAAATNAAERERISADASETQASYPPLAQHMNVQGSVVLQAIIGADGLVQNLHVLSGPAILAAAAQQAVREWRFKPVVQNGQAVETKAKITVNFNIKVAGNSETTIAESRPVPIESLMR
jgi:TonB family protein